jgi:predicted acylesterase/phospholipase RssA
LEECKIWEAGRATSAAVTFFDPIEIGRYKQRFVDGALGYNNPVQLVLREARQIWPDREALLISVGTGSAPSRPFTGNIMEIVESMKAMVTETEKTANDFFIDNRDMVDRSFLFRFNVHHGLANVGLEEHKETATIAGATESYLMDGETALKVQKCVEMLSDSQG